VLEAIRYAAIKFFLSFIPPRDVYYEAACSSLYRLNSRENGTLDGNLIEDKKAFDLAGK
jgi:hypothetical protein